MEKWRILYWFEYHRLEKHLFQKDRNCLIDNDGNKRPFYLMQWVQLRFYLGDRVNAFRFNMEKY